MKSSTKYFIECMGVILIAFAITSAVSFYGTTLREKGEKVYDDYCVSEGNEKFLSIDDGHIKCYRQDKLALYEDYLDNGAYTFGCFLEMFFLFNLLWGLSVVIIFMQYFEFRQEEKRRK